jgi:Excalibur calcium-binding domain
MLRARVMAGAIALAIAGAPLTQAAPSYAGQPGYRPALDRDGDRIACEVCH